MSINAFQITERPGRFLFLSAFIRDGRLVLISTYYPDLVINFRDVAVAVDGHRIDRFEEIGLNEYEPTRAVVYPIQAAASRHTVDITYNGHSRSYSIATDQLSDRPRFAVATLFKDDFQVVKTFVRYYREQGVERFYLFYNGDVQRVRHFLPDGEDIVYGSWDLPYSVDLAQATSPDRLVDAAAARSWHHAQTSFLTMVRHRYLDACSYLALIDLDEYLHVTGEKLKSHVSRIDAETLTVRSYWAEIRRPSQWMPSVLRKSRGIRLGVFLVQRIGSLLKRRLLGMRELPSLNYDDLRSTWVNVEHDGPQQVKTIYRGDYTGLFGVHEPKQAGRRVYSESIRLVHLANGTKGNRSHRIRPNAQPIDLVGGEK